MTEHIASPDNVPRYELHLQGHLNARWEIWFDGMTLTHEPDGTTSLRGPVIDQAALHGLLQKIRDLGVPLICVTQVDPIHPNDGSWQALLTQTSAAPDTCGARRDSDHRENPAFREPDRRSANPG